MKNIFVKENQKDKWDEFIASNPNGSFLQSWAWGEFQKSFGRKVWRLAIMENNEIASAALIIKHSLLFGWNYFYCPRPATETKNSKQKTKKQFLFFEEVKKMAKKEKAVFLKVDPTVCEYHSESKQCHPELVSGSVKFINRFRNKFGMTRKNKFGMTKRTKPIQPQHTLILDISKSEDEILARMKQKTRYNIRLAERKGVKIKKISQPNDQEIQTFLNLSAQTSERDKFQIHPKEYYQKMLKILCANSIAKLFLAEYQNKIIAANIVIFFSGKAIYLHGASSNNYRQAMTPYLLHWEQIKEAKKLGCKSYDFWGVKRQLPADSRQPTAAQAQSAWAGITRFKKGFGGEEISYPESYDIIFRPLLYLVYRIGKKVF